MEIVHTQACTQLATSTIRSMFFFVLKTANRQNGPWAPGELPQNLRGCLWLSDLMRWTTSGHNCNHDVRIKWCRHILPFFLSTSVLTCFVYFSFLVIFVHTQVKELKGEISSLKGTDHTHLFSCLLDKLKVYCHMINFNETVDINKLQATFDKARLSKAEDTAKLLALLDRLAFAN